MKNPSLEPGISPFVCSVIAASLTAENSWKREYWTCGCNDGRWTRALEILRVELLAIQAEAPRSCKDTDTVQAMAVADDIC